MNKKGKDVQIVESPVVESPVSLIPAEQENEVIFFDLFAKDERQIVQVKGIRQVKNVFNQPYVFNNAIPVPFKVTLCIAIAQNMMKAQGVDIVPVAAILTIARELGFDLRMQGRSEVAQIKAQVKNMRLGKIEDVTLTKGEKSVVRVSLIPASEEVVKKLDTCRYSSI